jgi:DNA-binding beta-propeller fold protein YncE
MGPGCLVVLSVAIIAIAGCSDDSTETETAPATTTIGDEAALPEPITAADAERVKLEDRLERELSLPDEPDWMVVAFDSLWTLKGNGDVLRIDPDTGKVLAEISEGEFSEPLCQGLGASEDAIWACPARGDPVGRVVRIDPRSNEIVSTLKTKKMQDQGRLVNAAGRLWLLTDAGETLTGVDLATERETSEIKLGETCTDLAASGTTLWAACPIEGHVLRIDAEAGEVTAEGAFSGARSTSVGDDLWVAFDGGVAQADPDSLEIDAVYEAEAAFGGTVYATDDEVWVREEGGDFLTRIDPGAQEITEVIEAPRLQSGGDVVVIGDSVWATAYDDSTMVQLKR